MIGVFLDNSGGDIRYLRIFIEKRASSLESHQIQKKSIQSTESQMSEEMMMSLTHGSRVLFGPFLYLIGTLILQVNFSRNIIQRMFLKPDMIFSFSG